MSSGLSPGAQAFIDGLHKCGIAHEVSGNALVFPLTDVVGCYHGQAVKTGVALDELNGWPMTPPHWVHLPADIMVGPTNSRPSLIEGWLMHSRNVAHWGNAKHPVQAWLAHVQSVLDVAVAA